MPQGKIGLALLIFKGEEEIRNLNFPIVLLPGRSVASRYEVLQPSRITESGVRNVQVRFMSTNGSVNRS